MFVQRMKTYFHQKDIQFFEKTENEASVLSLFDLNTFVIDNLFLSDIVFVDDTITLQYTTLEGEIIEQYQFKDIIDVILLLERIYTYNTQESQLIKEKMIIQAQLQKVK